MTGYALHKSQSPNIKLRNLIGNFTIAKPGVAAFMGTWTGNFDSTLEANDTGIAGNNLRFELQPNARTTYATRCYAWTKLAANFGDWIGVTLTTVMGFKGTGDGTGWVINLVPHAHLGGGVQTSEDAVNLVLTIMYEDGVSTEAGIETAIGLLTNFEVLIAGGGIVAITGESAYNKGLDRVKDGVYKTIDDALYGFTNDNLTARNGNLITDPDGHGMDAIVADINATNHGAHYHPTLTAANWAISAHFMAGNKTCCYIKDHTVSNAYAFFNLATGAVGTIGAGCVTAGMGLVGYVGTTPVYRCWIVVLGTAAGHEIRFWAADDAVSDITFAGDAATTNLYVGAYQVELGSLPTKYAGTPTYTISAQFTDAVTTVAEIEADITAATLYIGINVSTPGVYAVALAATTDDIAAKLLTGGVDAIAPVLNSGDGKGLGAITRTGVGTYTIAGDKQYNVLIDGQASFQAASAENTLAQNGVLSVVGGGSIEVRLIDSAGTPKDPTYATTSKVLFDLIAQETL